MEKKSFLKIGGAMLLMAIVLNIQYAWGDYGVKDNPLHLEVLAQNNDTGDGTAAESEGKGPLWEVLPETCTVTVTGAVGSTVTIFGIKLKVEAEGDASISVSNAATRCKSGGEEQCSSLSCGNFWIGYAQANGTAGAN